MSSPEQLAQQVKVASQQLRILGAGTKAGIGNGLPEAHETLSTSGLTEITYFAADEFVLSAQAGCKLQDLQTMLAEHKLSLPFLHPWAKAGATIGGALATNLGGPERPELGAPRDNILGVQYINGRGELLRAGGRVMKNVTGLDIARGLASSWGRLAVMTEITVKVVPLASMPDEVFDPTAFEGEELWRVSIPPAMAETASQTLSDMLLHSEWNGGLIWTSTTENVHDLAAQWDGHALRVKGEGPAFQPQSVGIKSLEARVKSALDPNQIFVSQYDG